MRLLGSILDADRGGASFVPFFERRVTGSALGRDAGQGRLSALSLLRRFGGSMAFSSLAFRFVSSFRCFLRSENCRAGAVTGRVGRLGQRVGITVGGSCVRVRGCTFQGCGVGAVRGGRARLSPRRLRGLRGLDLTNECAGLRGALSTFLFYYCTKVECSSFVDLSPSGVIRVHRRA